MRDNFGLKVPLHASANVEVILRKLPTGELRAFQQHHGLHVCPSEAEGFGHTLNEARACAALLITTDGSPMRDFVVPGETGLLVGVRDEDVQRFNSSIAFRVTPEAIAEQVREVLRLPVEDRVRMGARGRERYLADRSAFEASIASLIGPGGPLALGT
jgi:glycosyltransferase involved in cell wall biosynthesis